MTRDEEIKAAIIVNCDTIQFETPQMGQADAQLGLELSNLIDFIHSLHPILEKYEAMLLAAAVLEMLPKLFERNIPFLNTLADGAQKLIAAREQADDHDQPNQN